MGQAIVIVNNPMDVPEASPRGACRRDHEGRDKKRSLVVMKSEL
jgi:hypothetical protein